MDTSSLHNLSTDQKIELAFRLWDEIAASDTPVVLPDRVKAEIDTRCAELDADPSIAIDEVEMWRRVNEK